MNNRLTPSSGTVGVALLALGVVAIPANAYAYLDPGTGSVVLQVLIAGILGAVFTFKSYVRAIVSRVTGWFGRRDTGSNE